MLLRNIVRETLAMLACESTVNTLFCFAAAVSASHQVPFRKTQFPLASRAFSRCPNNGFSRFSTPEASQPEKQNGTLFADPSMASSLNRLHQQAGQQTAPDQRQYIKFL